MWTSATILGLAALLAAGAASAAAEPDRELALCAAESNSVKRLECFDALTRKRDVAAPEVKTTGSGKWEVRTETSKIDDSANVYLSVEANEAIPDQIGLSRVSPSLHIQCRENKTMLYIVWRRFIGIDDAYMTHRIDKAKATTSSWEISSDHEAVGKWSGGSSIPFIKGLFGKNQLLARITPYGTSAVTVTFDIGGLESAIAPLRKACDW